MRKALLISAMLFLSAAMMSAQSFRPVPHEVSADVKKTVNLSKGVLLIDPKNCFSEELSFLNLKSKGVALTVDFGADAALQAGVKACPGAYSLVAGLKGITIIGYDEKGAYNGILMLKKLVMDSQNMRMPVMSINDYPDSPSGFSDMNIKDPWGHEFRLEMIGLAGQLKMLTYVYSPVNDSYVSGSDWYMPYSQGKSKEIKELIDKCRINRMDFTWCICPDAEFTWSESDFSLLLGKFEMMHYLGVRSFGISFRNVPESDGVDEKKKALVERLNEDFIAKKKNLKPLLTDLDGFYLPEQGNESVKLGMYVTADRAWNRAAYDPVNSLDWAVNEIAPDAAGPYAAFARHSEPICKILDMEVSAGMEMIGLDGYAPEDYEALMGEFKLIEALPDSFSCTKNKALYNDLKPWIEEFGKLGTRGRRVLECISLFSSGDVPGFWSTYASNLMSIDDANKFSAYPTGTVKLQPYYESMMKRLAEAFDEAYKGKVGYIYVPGEGINTYIAPDEASSCHLILDNPDRRQVIVRLSDAKGRYTAEFCIDKSYFEFEMKDDAVNVEILGDVPVFETIFVK